MDSGFTSSQVVELTGITLRQLQWWDERGMVVPLRQGHRRLYSLEDLAEIAVICELRQRGLSLQRVRKVMAFLQCELGKRLCESTSANSQVHLLTDGKNIFIRNSPESIVDVLRNSRQPILAVCLSDTVQRVQAGIRVGSPQPSAETDVAKVGPRSGKRAAAAKPRLARASRG
jgi:DNA-binding transcriptional MerR regulator